MKLQEWIRTIDWKVMDSIGITVIIPIKKDNSKLDDCTIKEDENILFDNSSKKIDDIDLYDQYGIEVLLNEKDGDEGDVIIFNKDGYSYIKDTCGEIYIIK